MWPVGSHKGQSEAVLEKCLNYIITSKIQTSMEFQLIGFVSTSRALQHIFRHRCQFCLHNCNAHLECQNQTKTCLKSQLDREKQKARPDLSSEKGEMLKTVPDINCVVRMQCIISNGPVLKNTIIKMFLRNMSSGEQSLSIILILSLLIFSNQTGETDITV